MSEKYKIGLYEQYQSYAKKNIIRLIDEYTIKYQLNQWGKHKAWKKKRNIAIKKEKKNCRTKQRKFKFPKIANKPKINHLLSEETLWIQLCISKVLKWSFDNNQIFIKNEDSFAESKEYRIVSTYHEKQIFCENSLHYQ